MQRHSVPCVIAVMMLACVPACTVAQTYPVKPVRIIVPFPPGGGADILLRGVAPKVGEALGQQVVVDNRAGASGLIGGELGARAAPDGYTLIMATSSNFSIDPNLVAKPPYDPVRDFAPVVLMAQAPLLLAIHPSLPAKSTKELIQLAKIKPKALLYASNGTGSISHLTSELFSSAAKIEMVHVPYKGGTPAATDTIAGHVSLIITAIPTLSAHAKSGRLRALGVTGTKRAPMFPEVPTIAESALPGFESTQWYGLFAPRNVPADRIARLHREFDEVLRRADTAELYARDGSEPTPMGPNELSAFLKRDIGKWSALIKSKNLQTH